MNNRQIIKDNKASFQPLARISQEAFSSKIRITQKLYKTYICSKKSHSFGLFCLFLLMCGCTPPQASFTPSGSHYDRKELSGKTGQISLFLNLKKQKVSIQKLVIQSIEIASQNNQWTFITTAPVVAEPKTMKTGQIFLGRTSLAPGNYSRLRITTSRDPRTGIESESSVIELAIHRPLYVAKGDSHSLFITWYPGPALTAGPSSRPVLSLAPQLKNMPVDVAYVACPEIDTIYMICTDKNRVCNSLGVQSGPSYLLGDPHIPTASLYTLTEREKNIKRIGPSSNRIEATYRLPALGKDLTFAIGPNGRWGFVADRKRGNILKIDLRSGSTSVRNRLGYGPSYILYLEEQGVLAVSLSLSQTVVLLDPETLAEVQRISTGNKPEGLMLFKKTLLYIAETGSNSVMVYDLSRSKIQKRIPVGQSPRRIAEASGRIYVTNHNSRSISILTPGQLGVSKTIALDGPPLELAYSQTAKWLYVGNGIANTLDIINPANNRMAGRIPLGALPQGIAVLQ